jgi:hypothetical protein
MAITWNSNADEMLKEKIKALREALKEIVPKCGLKACVDTEKDCPVYGSDKKKCVFYVLSDELDQAENYSETYKSWQKSRVLANREKDMADYDCMLAEAQAALELEINGQVSTKTADLVRSARSLAQAKNDEFQTVANRKNQLETVRGK